MSVSIPSNAFFRLTPFHGCKFSSMPQDGFEESEEFRSSFILVGSAHPSSTAFSVLMRIMSSIPKPDIFDNDEVEIEISSTLPTLSPSSSLRRQVSTGRGMLCVGQQRAHPETS